MVPESWAENINMSVHCPWSWRILFPKDCTHDELLLKYSFLMIISDGNLYLIISWPYNLRFLMLLIWLFKCTLFELFGLFGRIFKTALFEWYYIFLLSKLKCCSMVLKHRLWKYMSTYSLILMSNQAFWRFLNSFWNSAACYFTFICHFLWFTAGGGSSCSPVLSRKPKGDYFRNQSF